MGLPRTKVSRTLSGSCKRSYNLDGGIGMNELMSKLGDQQAKYNFQGTIAFIIMKSLQAISFGGNRPWT